MLLAMMTFSGCAEQRVDISGKGNHPIVSPRTLAQVTSVQLVPIPNFSGEMAKITVTDPADLRPLLAALDQSPRELLLNDWTPSYGRPGVEIDLYAGEEKLDSAALFAKSSAASLLPGNFLRSTELRMLEIPPDLAEAVYWCIEHARQRGEPVKALALRFDAFTPPPDPPAPAK